MIFLHAKPHHLPEEMTTEEVELQMEGLRQINQVFEISYREDRFPSSVLFGNLENDKAEAIEEIELSVSVKMVHKGQRYIGDGVNMINMDSIISKNEESFQTLKKRIEETENNNEIKNYNESTE